MKPNETLLHYRIVDKLGEGGMGVVWRAVDTTLDRTVAIKSLPETFATDPERLARFEREAKSLAALNHPHIAGIFGIHEADTSTGSVRFLSMEFVEGEDLSQRLKRGPLPVEDAVEIAMAVADALSAAHSNGVVHRDLKPANVMLTADGEPKVLDFGLAKATLPDGMSSGSASASPALSPTVTSFGTVAGVILGTAAYMSPEQARARPVDKRADLWALGAVLYEMLTGKPPFKGETISDTLASVLKSDPDWDALPAGTPPAVRRLLRRCLEKNPKQRLHDAADARIELSQAFDEPETVGVAAPSSRSSRIWIGAAALALIGGLALGYVLWGGGTKEATTTSATRVVSTLPAPEGVFVSVRQLSLALSPDGEQLAFVGFNEEGRAHLYVRRLDSNDARRIEETDGVETFFWSYDGRELGFHSGSRLMRVPVEGGTPQLISEVNGRDGAWGPDGTILIGSYDVGPLMRVNSSGGEPKPVAGAFLTRGQQSMTPQFLPDGRHYIFHLEDLSGGVGGIYLGELDSSESKQLTEGLWNAAYADGQLLFFKDDTLLAQRLDVAAGVVLGEPRRVAGPVLKSNYPFHGFFSVAPSGRRLVYLRGTQAAGLADLVWVDRSGTELERPGINGDLYNPRLSHDGRKLAIDISTQETHGDIWVFDLGRGSSRRLTRDPIDESLPVWMPDDSELLFFRVPDLYVIDATGGSEPRLINIDDKQKSASDISPDGRWALFNERIGDRTNIRILDLESGEAQDWLSTEFFESDARFSPDGRWVAYLSTESGRDEVYIDRFPERGERFRVSDDGGSWPVWRRDGTELFYVSGTNDLMAVAVDMDSDRDPVGTPQKLFTPHLRRSYFDVSVDGERFLLVERVDPEASAVTLVQNW